MDEVQQRKSWERRRERREKTDQKENTRKDTEVEEFEAQFSRL